MLKICWNVRFVAGIFERFVANQTNANAGDSQCVLKYDEIPSIVCDNNIRKHRFHSMFIWRSATLVVPTSAAAVNCIAQ